MSDSARLPAVPFTPELLRGLNEVDADRPAIEVMSAVAWEGLALDPETTTAEDFLAQL